MNRLFMIKTMKAFIYQYLHILSSPLFFSDPCLNFYCAHEGTCELANLLDLTPQCNCMGDWTGDHCDGMVTTDYF